MIKILNHLKQVVIKIYKIYSIDKYYMTVRYIVPFENTLIHVTLMKESNIYELHTKK